MKKSNKLYIRYTVIITTITKDIRYSNQNHILMEFVKRKKRVLYTYYARNICTHCRYALLRLLYVRYEPKTKIRLYLLEAKTGSRKTPKIVLNRYLFCWSVLYQ